MMHPHLSLSVAHPPATRQKTLLTLSPCSVTCMWHFSQHQGISQGGQQSEMEVRAESEEGLRRHPSAQLQRPGSTLECSAL